MFKESEPNLVTYYNSTPIFEWCVVTSGSKRDTKVHVF